MTKPREKRGNDGFHSRVVGDADALSPREAEHRVAEREECQKAFKGKARCVYKKRPGGVTRYIERP